MSENRLTRVTKPVTRNRMKPTGFLPRVSAGSLLALLAACAVGPNYHQPAAPDVAGYTPSPLPPAAGKGDAQQVYVQGADISADWWSLYRSPALNSLIASALRNSPNLDAARNTLIAAEENVRSEQGNFFP